MAASKPQLEVFQDKSGQYRWRLRAINGEIIATSGESYERKQEVSKAIMRVKAAVPAAVVEDVEALHEDDH
jgi:uncharacterized protein YegP (UPF0339 family)